MNRRNNPGTIEEQDQQHWDRVLLFRTYQNRSAAGLQPYKGVERSSCPDIKVGKGLGHCTPSGGLITEAPLYLLKKKGPAPETSDDALCVQGKRYPATMVGPVRVFCEGSTPAPKPQGPTTMDWLRDLAQGLRLVSPIDGQPAPLTAGVNLALVHDEAVAGLSSETRRIHGQWRSDDVKTTLKSWTELANGMIREAALRSTYHPDYDRLASRLQTYLWRTLAPRTFAEAVRRMHQHVHQITGEPAPLISDELAALFVTIKGQEPDPAVMERIEAALDHGRDATIPYAGLTKLRHSYLTTDSRGQLLETPQYMWMRVALGIHGPRRIDAALETYDLMSRLIATHASPTLFNAGRPKAQMASCFLATVTADSMEGIFETLKQCALISQRAGGLGVSVHKLRAQGSYVRGCNGRSQGLVSWLRFHNLMVQVVDQGGGKRKGAETVYLEPWHADFADWLDLKLPQAANEACRARDLFYASWTPDLLMKRVAEDGQWSFFCPDEAPGLADVWGKEFEELYECYEREGRARNTVPARSILQTICERQLETGGPFVLFKDACNRKSNQQHLGTIRGSNLCTEIVQYTSPEEIAVCNLASIALPRFVRHGKCIDDPLVSRGAEGTDAWFDQYRLYEVVRILVRNLNRVIERNHYPVPQARFSNLKHRPIGLGVQGFADTLAAMGWSWQDPEARRLNLEIFETIYFAALSQSCAMAQENKQPHHSYEGSPASQGLLQMDLWEREGRLPKAWKGKVPLTPKRWNWTWLRERISKHGLLNSLLVAPMPTVSTSKVLGNSPGIEPYHAHVFLEKALSGDSVHLTRGLVERLIAAGLWDLETREEIIRQEGLLGDCQRVPADLKRLYRTGWEVPLRTQIDMAADRGVFVDQSQSLNLWINQPSAETLGKVLTYGWRRGLKTACYYTHTRMQTLGQKLGLRSASSSSTASISDKTSSDSEMSDDTSNDDDGGEGPSQPQGQVRVLRRGAAVRREDAGDWTEEKAQQMLSMMTTMTDNMARTVLETTDPDVVRQLPSFSDRCWGPDCESCGS